MADELNPTPTPETDPGKQTPPTDDSQGFFAKLAEMLHPSKDPAPASETKAGGDTLPETDPAMTFSEDDLNAKLEEARQKWEADLAEKERLAKLSPEDRAKAEEDAKGRELAEAKAELLRRDLRETAVKELDTGKFPVGLADLLDYSSKEKMTASLETVKKVFTESLATAINEKLRGGKIPEGLGGANTAENAIKDEIAAAVRGAI